MCWLYNNQNAYVDKMLNTLQAFVDKIHNTKQSLFQEYLILIHVCWFMVLQKTVKIHSIQ